MARNFLQFEDYYFNQEEEEYSRDRENAVKLLTRRKNQCMKLLSEENIQKLVNCLIFMRNIFVKEAILEYIISYFKMEISLDIILIIHFMLIQEDSGIIVDQGKFLFNSSVLDKVLGDYENEKVINIIKKLLR